MTKYRLVVCAALLLFALPASAHTTPTPSRLRLWWQRQSDGCLSAWNTYDRIMVGGQTVTPFMTAGTGWKIVGSGDFNHDSQPDLVWQNQSSGNVTVWLMDDTTFLGPGILSPNTVTDPHWAVRAIADMDDDGQPDIVWQHETEGWLSVWLMDGLFLREGVALTPNWAHPDWRLAAVADLNGDGKQDLLWQNRWSGMVSAWLMDGTQYTGIAAVGSEPVTDPNWILEAAIDVDGDAVTDLLWHHQTSGVLAVWYMDGPNVRSGETFTPPEVSPDWDLVAATMLPAPALAITLAAESEPVVAGVRKTFYVSTWNLMPDETRYHYWDWTSDGIIDTTSFINARSHIYEAPGEYNLTVTVTTSKGRSATATLRVIVVSGIP